MPLVFHFYPPMFCQQTMKGFYLFLFALWLTCLPQRSQAQTDEPSDSTVSMPHYVRVSTYVYKGDTIPNITLTTPLYKYPPTEFKNEKQRRRHKRLVRNIKKVLPYAKTAKLLILETYSVMQTLPTEEEKKQHLKRMEDELTRTYTPILKKMSRSQGRLLIKLIDRECHQTGFSIAKAFLGPTKANFYQGIAFLFGHSLAKKYDPEGKDRDIEQIVRMIESGQL